MNNMELEMRTYIDAQLAHMVYDYHVGDTEEAYMKMADAMACVEMYMAVTGREIEVTEEQYRILQILDERAR